MQWEWAYLTTIITIHTPLYCHHHNTHLTHTSPPPIPHPPTPTGTVAGGIEPDKALGAYGCFTRAHPSTMEQGLRMLIGAAVKEGATRVCCEFVCVCVCVSTTSITPSLPPPSPFPIRRACMSPLSFPYVPHWALCFAPCCVSHVRVNGGRVRPMGLLVTVMHVVIVYLLIGRSSGGGGPGCVGHVGGARGCR